MRWWKVILLMVSMMLCLGVPAQAGNEASSAEIDVADILFGHTDAKGVHFRAMICIPDGTACYMIELTVSLSGEMAMTLRDY